MFWNYHVWVYEVCCCRAGLFELLRICKAHPVKVPHSSFNHLLRHIPPKNACAGTSFVSCDGVARNGALSLICFSLGGFTRVNLGLTVVFTHAA